MTFLKANFRNFLTNCLMNINIMKKSQKSVICDFVTSNLRCILIPDGGGSGLGDVIWKGHSAKGDIG